MAAGAGATVGVDVGGTKILAVVLGPDDEVLDERRLPTPREGPELLEAVGQLVGELGRAAPLAGVGVGLPGLIDRDGTLRVAPNLRQMDGLAVGPWLRQHVGLPARIDNDANCAAWAERQLGAARGVDDCVLVTLGTGIGGGIVVDGVLLRGARGFAGEIGHMVVVRDGVPCPCGRRGCWERYASGSGLGRMGREAAQAGQLASAVALAGRADAVDGRHVTEAALAGHADARAVLEEVAGWLAVGLANLANVLDPALFVVGGGLVAAGEALFGPASAGLSQRLMAAGRRPDVPVVPAVLGQRAGAIGAALLARPAGR
jgi:glucokinase